MPADPTQPDQLGSQARFRADLVAYLDSLPVQELADLLGELPSSRPGRAWQRARRPLTLPVPADKPRRSRMGLLFPVPDNEPTVTRCGARFPAGGDQRVVARRATTGVAAVTRRGCQIRAGSGT